MLGKNIKKTSLDDAVTTKVNQDLIVHNMPNSSRVDIAAKPKFVSGSQFLPKLDKKNNFKVVGGLIIGLGAIFVGTLIYLSYYFIIKPRLNPSTTIVAPPIVENIPTTETSTDIMIATTTVSTPTDLAEVDSTVIEVNNDSNTASTTTINENNNEAIINLPPLVDIDGDGLNDEEELILGTNSNASDTDADGYADLAELKNGYSPTSAGTKFYPNSITTKYSNKVGKYELYYPISWGIKNLNNDYTAIISAPDDSLVQISVQDNPNIQNILTWYGLIFPGEVVTDDRLKNGDNWEGVMGLDGLNFYLTDKNRENIYVISYISANSDRLVYPNIFQMIINSFKLNLN